jgi:hypothetical protein
LTFRLSICTQQILNEGQKPKRRRKEMDVSNR